MGANIVKCTTPYPCLVSNESNSKLTLTLNFVKERIVDINNNNNNHHHLQSQAIYHDKSNSKKNLHILEDGASGVQVGDIEQAIV